MATSVFVLSTLYAINILDKDDIYLQLFSSVHHQQYEISLLKLERNKQAAAQYDFFRCQHVSSFKKEVNRSEQERPFSALNDGSLRV